MKNTFHQTCCPVILLLCFALIFQPELSAQANGQSCIFHNNDRLLEEVTDGNSIYYDYDDNGSLTQKVDGSITTDYTYDLKGRLALVSRTGDLYDICYKYNPDGIRVQTKLKAGSMVFPYRRYLIDPYNHTCYAQVFREVDESGSTPSQTVYILGNDVLAQAKNSPTPEYLLYDGHGSVRQLTNSSGSVIESYSYDAYGVMLGGNPTSDSPAATNLLYAGEHFDTDSQHYYNRARWYDPLNGRFNRMDPFSGSAQDPQSLHKYLYCHANPVMGIDPSGKFSLCGTIQSIAINGILMNIVMPVLAPLVSKAASYLLPASWKRVLKTAKVTAIMGGVSLAGSYRFVTGEGNLEAVGSIHNGNVAVYAGWRAGLAYTGAPGLGITASGYFGLVFNAAYAGDYAGSSVALTLGYYMLPQKIKSAIYNGLLRAAGAYFGPPIVGGDWDMNRFIEYRRYTIQQAQGKMSRILNVLNNSDVTITGMSGSQGPVVTVTFGISSLIATHGIARSPDIALTYGQSYQIYPGDDKLPF